MLEITSPYALLKSSKPRPQPQMKTYDLFSTIQQQASLGDQPAKETLCGNMPSAVDSAVSHYAPSPRTHYIAQIHTKHSCASKKAAMLSAMQPHSPSFQAPSM